MAGVGEGGTLRDWSPVRQTVAVVAWCSFLAACVETMGFFAYLDPATVGCTQLPPEAPAIRHAAYAIGFFFFWMSTVVAATLTAYLLYSGRRVGR